MQVYLFGAISSLSCAIFCLRQTAIDFGNQFDPEISSIIQQNLYVVSRSLSLICHNIYMHHSMLASIVLFK